MATAAAALTIQHITTIYLHLHSIMLLLFLHLFFPFSHKKNLTIFALLFALHFCFKQLSCCTALLLHSTTKKLNQQICASCGVCGIHHKSNACLHT